MYVSRYAFALIVIVCLGLTACGPGGAPDPGATGETAADADVDINALIASADLKRGETLYLQCRACHSLGEGEANKVACLAVRRVWHRVLPTRTYSSTLTSSGRPKP